MVNTHRIDKLLVHLRSFFKKMGLLPSTLCLFSGSKWCARKKKPNFNGHGKEYEE